MPIYTYNCTGCDYTSTKIVSVEARDAEHKCDVCGKVMGRGIDRPGLVWAPTAGGMR